MSVTFTGTQPANSQWATQGLTSPFTVLLSGTKTTKVDKKEIKGAEGDVITVGYFNKRVEVSAEGYGGVLGTAGADSEALGQGFKVEEYTVTYSNEDFPKFSVKGTQYLLSSQ